ncbi:MAG: PAS domain S-box protein [Desulfobacterales bacterium]|nr:PAS domain S-box protein [Desulfobacterales bacterium]
MSRNPTYTELEQKINELTQEIEQIRLKERNTCKSNELLSSVLNRISDPICVKDENHRWVMVNDKYCEFAGAARKSILGKSNYDFFSKKDADNFWLADNEVLQSGTENLNEEYLTNQVTGQKTFLNIQKSLYKDKDDEKFIIAVCKDITDRKKVENDLTLERLQILSLFNSINQIIYVVDPKTYEILYVNDSLKGLLKKNPVGSLCYKEFYGFSVPCPFCTNNIILNNKNTPYQWEHRNSFLNKDLMIIDKIIKWPDGRDVRFEIAFDITDRKKAEKALYKSNFRLELALKFSNIGLFEWNTDTNDVYFSPEWKSQLGYSEDEVVDCYEEWESRLHPEDRDHILKGINDYIEGHMNKYEQEFRLRHKDGSYCWILSRGEMINYHDEQSKKILGCHFDITDLKKNEEAIIESEKRFRELSELLPETIFETDERGNLTFVNLKALDHFGYTHEDFENGLNIFEMIVPEELAGKMENFKKVMDGEQIGLNEITALKKNGDTFPALINSSAILQDGKAIGLRGCVIDLTELKQSEAALRDSELRYRNVVEDMPAMICRFLPDGTLTFVNSFYSSYYCKKKEELIGHSFFQFFPEDKREKVKNHFMSLDEKTPMVIYEQKIFIPGKGIRWQEWTDRVLFDPYGTVVEYQSIGRDITDVKIAHEEKAEMERRLQQAQKMEAIGTLSGGIAHDFNNILSVIIGYAEMMELFDIDEGSEARSRLDAILTGARRATDLVKQILTFSRQSDQKKKPVQLGIIVKEAIKFLRASLPSTIEIVQHIENQKSLILADTTQMHQVVMNLCTNAAQAMRTSGSVLKVDLTEETIEEQPPGTPDLVPGLYVRLTISDTGPGISPEILDRIFDPYFTTKEKGEGTGLGLAVVHGIVKSHHGTIIVSSELEKGSVFQIYLPVLETGTDLMKSRSVEPLSKGNERILFVDDELIIVDMAQKVLNHLGYEVSARYSGPDALEAFRTNPGSFDMVITDMTMPSMTGIELSKALLDIRPDIPIILCTGFNMPITSVEIRKTGIRELLMKPVGMHDLAEKVRKVLDDKDRI